MAQSTIFGTNLPKNFANLAGVDTAGTYGDIPQYMLDLLATSQAPATSAAASTSPGATAPVAAPQRYASLDWKGLAGREAIPSMKGGGNPSYQIPIEQLADFMKSGYGSNFRSSGSFNEGESTAPKVNMATGTNPLTGKSGEALFFADKNPELGYRGVTGGGYIEADNPYWKFRTAAQAAPAPVTEEPPASVPLTPAPAQNPYVLTETPDEFKYAEGGLVEVADQLRQKGRMGDSILAHISPDEARMLKMMGGSGSINPATGLPEYFGFKDIIKVAAPIVGSMLGGPAGAAIGGAIGGAADGGGIKGALMGGLGSLATGFMANGAMGGMGGGSGLGSIMNLFGGGNSVSGGGSQEQLSGDAGNDDLDDTNNSFVAQGKRPDIMGALKDPLVLSGLGLAALASGGTDKRNKKLLQEQREERRAKEEQESQEFRAMIAGQTPRTVNTPPPDYYTYGTRPEFNYFGNNTGGVSKFASGGYVEGAGGGQDDAIQARLSNNEYVIPADVVAHLGDGAPKVGAKKLDDFLKNVRSHKAVKGHPPKAKSVQKYVGGLSGRA